MDKTQGLQLRDIHLPADPGYWPLAPGWWLLIVLVLITVYFLVKKLNKMRQRKHTIQLLQSKLSQLRENYNQHKSKHRLAVEISDLLKRFVRHVLNDSQATALSGKEWINYLNKLSNSEVFTEFKQELTQAQYSPNIDYDVSKLVAQVKNFFPIAIDTKSRNSVTKKSRGVKNA